MKYSQTMMRNVTKVRDLTGYQFGYFRLLLYLFPVLTRLRLQLVYIYIIIIRSIRLYRKFCSFFSNMDEYCGKTLDSIKQ